MVEEFALFSAQTGNSSPTWPQNWGVLTLGKGFPMAVCTGHAQYSCRLLTSWPGGYMKHLPWTVVVNSYLRNLPICFLNLWHFLSPAMHCGSVFQRWIIQYVQTVSYFCCLIIICCSFISVHKRRQSLYRFSIILYMPRTSTTSCFSHFSSRLKQPNKCNWFLLVWFGFSLPWFHIPKNSCNLFVFPL